MKFAAVIILLLTLAAAPGATILLDLLESTSPGVTGYNVYATRGTNFSWETARVFAVGPTNRAVISADFSASTWTFRMTAKTAYAESDFSNLLQVSIPENKPTLFVVEVTEDLVTWQTYLIAATNNPFGNKFFRLVARTNL